MKKRNIDHNNMYILDIRKFWKQKRNEWLHCFWRWKAVQFFEMGVSKNEHTKF